MFNRMAAVLWVIAVLSNLTVIHRIIYTWQQANRVDAAEARASAAPAAALQPERALAESRRG